MTIKALCAPAQTHIACAATAQQKRSMQCRCTVGARRNAQASAVPSKDGYAHGIYYSHMAVRDYELDQFSVVNNGIYASYLQHARHKALAAVGMSVESLQQAGTLLALSELVMRYKAPLRAQDIFVVTAAVSKVQGARLVLEQTVLRLPQPQEHSDDSGFTVAPELVLDGQATVVFLDTSYRPIRIPAQAKQTCQRLQADYSKGNSQQF